MGEVVIYSSVSVDGFVADVQPPVPARSAGFGGHLDGDLRGMEVIGQPELDVGVRGRLLWCQVTGSRAWPQGLPGIPPVCRHRG